jgi:hypothetical protein
MNKAFDHSRMQTVAVRPRIRIRLNQNRLWRWQLWLVERLVADGYAPELDLVAGRSLASPVRILLAIERAVFGLVGEHASDLIDVNQFTPVAAISKIIEPVDLNLNLADAATDDSEPQWLRPAYDGEACEDALISALLDGRRVHLAIASARGVVASALPAVEDDLVLTRALDAVFSSLLRLCAKAIDDPDGSSILSESPLATTHHLSWRAIGFAAATIAAKASGRLTKLCTRAPAWSIQWRWAAEDPIGQTHALPKSGFRRLADDRRRYYADPFVIDVAGIHYMFCEEFDYATGKAFISVTTMPRDGEPNTPRPVLEAAHHLSYPFVFAHGGEMWMVPESSVARTVDLYRADPFPDRWVHEMTLLSDVQASDATLFTHNGEWWMFASTVERQSSSWDGLSIFHSATLFGPWIAHPRNPVLIDARAARPAGQIYRSGGLLWRPAQDCSEDYGNALALCSIDRLDHENFAQTARVRLRLAAPAHGPHTLNWTAGLEVIDAFV